MGVFIYFHWMVKKIPVALKFDYNSAQEVPIFDFLILQKTHKYLIKYLWIKGC